MSNDAKLFPKNLDELEEFAIKKFEYVNPFWSQDQRCRNKPDGKICLEGECVGGVKDIVLCKGGQCSQGYVVDCRTNLDAFR